MGKYSVNQATLDKIRAARVRYLTPGAEAKAPANWEKMLEEQKMVGPWKWWERVRVSDVQFMEQSETSKDGRLVDRLDITFDVDPGSATNADRRHVEYIRLDEGEFNAEAGGAVYSQRTNYSLGFIDRLITALRGEDGYVIDDNGEGDPIETVKQLVGSEVLVRCDLRTKKNKETGEWSANFSFAEFAAIE